MKKFELYAFCILHDHVHILLKPGKEFNISNIMSFLKGNFSRDINKLIKTSRNEDVIPESRLHGEQYSFNKKRIFKTIEFEKYLKNTHLLKSIPEFTWQKSYHDHYVRNDQDFRNHYLYVIHNFQKHMNYPDDYKYVSTNYEYLIDISPI